MNRLDPAIILEAVRAHMIDAGVASVHRTETRAFRREGCLEGFRLAGALPLNPEPWAELLEERHAFEHGMRGSGERTPETTDAFWRYRCATAQIEYVYERLRVVWQAHGLDAGPISARACLDVYRFLATTPSELRRARP